MAADQGEGLEARRRRLRWLASKRGTLEAELLLRPFVKARLQELDARGLAGLEALLSLGDLDLWEVLTGRRPAPRGVDPALVAELRKAARPRSPRG
jgi:antitoxin CptB